MRALLCAAAVLFGACRATVAAAPAKMPSAKSTTPKQTSGRPALAVSPSQTISPAGLQRLASALERKGLWLPETKLSREAIAAAVITFQEQQQLAATGYPDTETLRRLGLSPNDVADAAQPQPRGATP